MPKSLLSIGTDDESYGGVLAAACGARRLSCAWYRFTMPPPCPRYKDYASLPEHIKAMLRAVTHDDAAAERYLHAPNKNLKGQPLFNVINAPFGQRVAERFLYDLGNYLGVDEDMDEFKKSFGKKK